MFFTLQFPFADLRPFVLHRPDTVLDKLNINDAFELLEDRKGFIRSFGEIRKRGYVPKFKSSKYRERPEKARRYVKNWGDLDNLWSDEYCYFGAQRALRFNKIECQRLVGNKLYCPYVKVRALHLSRYDPGQALWSPGMRIETGIYYTLTKYKVKLNEDDIGLALKAFLRLPTLVPVYRSDAELSSQGNPKKQIIGRSLICQQDSLAKLILAATTSQSQLRTHTAMIASGAPLLALHYFADELEKPLLNVDWLPQELTEGVKIGYFPLRTPWGIIGTWVFELPSTRLRTERVRKAAIKQRVIIRNYTIAIMRYWSELRAALLIAKSISSGVLNFAVDDKSLLQSYLKQASGFLFSPKWHGADLQVVRNTINAYDDVLDDEAMRIARLGFQSLNHRIASKARSLLGNSGNVLIFISYSHKDAIWRARVQEAVGALHNQHQIAYFDDTSIEPGSQWLKKILHSVKTAKIAILLVSDDFHASEFIAKNEVPIILERYTTGNMEVIPVWIDGDNAMTGKWSGLQWIRSSNGALRDASPEQVEEAMGKLVKQVGVLLRQV
jgi:hypothetical protein